MERMLKQDLQSEDAADRATSQAGIPVVSWRHYVDLLNLNQEGKLEKAALTIQTGLDKAERTLQTSLGDSRREQQLALAEAEKRVNERFVAFKESADKTEQMIMGRLARQDEGIQRIERERPLYVTRDQLELIMKADIRPLEKSANAATGQRQGANAMFGYFMVVIGLIIGMGGLIAAFMRH